MLSRLVVLLCVCFAMSTASADDLRPLKIHADEARSILSLKIHADEARSVLSTLPEECTTDSDLITTEYVKSLYSIFNCSYSEVIEGAANVALETGAYVAMDYKTISKLLRTFMSCAAELNPLKVVECDFNGVVNAYGEIKNLITSTLNFITDMKTMIPPLKQEVRNCLQSSSIEYQMFLNKLVHNARTCAKK